MSLADMLGVRVEKLHLHKEYSSIDALFDAIKDIQFTAGKPELVKNGLTKIIVFPQIDRNNQVQILGVSGNFSVQRSSVPAGVGNLLKNIALDELTDGWASLSAAFGDKKKLCLELTSITAKEIHEAGI